jgi:hypothetical protein
MILEVETSGGRRVQLTQLHVIPTWTWRTADPVASEQNWRELLTRLFGTPDLPVVILPEAEGSWVTCIGSFISQALNSRENWKDYSCLVIAWFTGPNLPTVRDFAATALSRVEWEVHAKDFDSWEQWM